MDEIQVHPQPVAHVRGHAAFDRPAGLFTLSAAAFADLSLSATAFFVLLRLLDVPPLPRLWWVPALAAVTAIAWFGSRAFFGQSAGEKLWRLSPAANSTFGAPRQSTRLGSSAIGPGIFLTALVWTGATLLITQVLLKHPVLLRAESVSLAPFIPATGAAASDEEVWGIEPFYYSLGAWPRSFGGKPIFLTIPYEKGPPTRFAGHIVARWQMPDIRLTFEGPKTPGIATAGERLSREMIRGCLTFEAGAASLNCLAIRTHTLLRHIEEMKLALAAPGSPTPDLRDWSLRWLTVTNPALPPDEQTQGFYVSARTQARGQDRFILVTAGGTNQAFTLDYPAGTEGAKARALFERAIRSLRVSDDLGPGRAWIDRELETVKLSDLDGSAATPAEVLARISAVQAMLIAKISVDPKTYDSYYHLGGTALLLARYATSHRATDDWVASAKQTLQSVHRYAQDLAPEDPRTAGLQGFLLEAQKY